MIQGLGWVFQIMTSASEMPSWHGFTTRTTGCAAIVRGETVARERQNGQILPLRMRLSMLRLWIGNASNDSTTFQRNKYWKCRYQNLKTMKDEIWLKTLGTFQSKLPSVSTMRPYWRNISTATWVRLRKSFSSLTNHTLIATEMRLKRRKIKFQVHLIYAKLKVLLKNIMWGVSC